MKYLPDILLSEYVRLTTLYPDIEGILPPNINISDVFKAYFILAHYFTDESSEGQESMLVGLRSIELLESALGRQWASFSGKQKYTDKVDICATLFFGLVKNHAFSDGNKRTALLVLLYQLQLCGYLPKEKIREFEKLVVSVAASKIQEDYRSKYKKFEKDDDAEVKCIAFIIRKMVMKKSHAYGNAPTAKQFCSVLTSLGVTCNLENGKLHFCRDIKEGFLGLKTVQKKHAIVFGGWTRVITAKQAREILEKIDLYDQYPSYSSLLNGDEPMYSLISQYEKPLRRLKDE